MMKLVEFRDLDLTRQAEIAWEEGILEGHWRNDEHYFMLYKLSDFFVEITLHGQTDEIIQVRSFA